MSTSPRGIDGIGSGISKRELRELVQRKMSEWKGLLEREAATILVLDEIGSYHPRFDRIDRIGNREKVSLRVKVERVISVRDYKKENGKTGRVAALLVKDESGSCRLLLWDREVQMLGKEIDAGKWLRIINACVKRTDQGMELRRGKFGAILPEPLDH